MDKVTLCYAPQYGEVHILIRNKAVWYAVGDVARVLHFESPKAALDILREDGQQEGNNSSSVVQYHYPDSGQGMDFICEGSLFFLAGCSPVQDAGNFAKWAREYGARSRDAKENYAEVVRALGGDLRTSQRLSLEVDALWKLVLAGCPDKSHERFLCANIWDNSDGVTSGTLAKAYGIDDKEMEGILCELGLRGKKKQARYRRLAVLTLYLEMLDRGLAPCGSPNL